jgi:hypothetical protein
MTIQAAYFRTTGLEFRPIEPEMVQALLAGDLSVVAAGQGWPHVNTMLGLRMGAQQGLPYWLVELDGQVVGDCGTLGPANSEGEIEIGCGVSESYAEYRGQLVRGLTAWLHGQPGITNVTGESPDSSDEPPATLSDPAALLDGYLDYYRNAVLRKLDGMTDGQLRASQVPSGWTPIGLLNHLTLMEMRWFRWGFLAEPIAEPWGGGGPGSDWQVPADRSRAELVAAFEAEAARSRAVVAGASLDTVAAIGGRFSEFGVRPTLAWILFHVLQEYARHVGHLDISRELVDGALGE